MYTLKVCVPSARLCAPLNRAFRRHGVSARAYTALPTDLPLQTIELMPCVIEPATKEYLWFVLDNMKPCEFMSMSFLDESFMEHLRSKAQSEHEEFAMDCLFAMASAKHVTEQAKNLSAKRLTKCAEKFSADKNMVHLAEHVLRIPSLSSLMREFVDNVLATGRIASA